MQERVAVIGAGVAGMTAAYLLRHRYEVTLFEADDRFGGHAHTHRLESGGETFGVDSGFIVHNHRTYPYLLKLFAELGIATQQTEMSMSIDCAECGLAYAGGRGLPGIFAQRRRWLDPRFLAMLTQVPRFHRAAKRLLAQPQSQQPTWGEFLRDGKYSDYFIHHFAIPLVSCVWSSGHEDATAYPARHLFQFLEHHGMLTVKGSPTWYTVVGGSRSYVDALISRLSDARVSTAVRSVRRDADGVQVDLADGRSDRFDRVVIATHAKEALAMLSDATDAERSDLAAIGYSANETWLHTDASVLPAPTAAKASWNYRMQSCNSGSDRVLVSYWMNKLQRLAAADDFVVTLNAAGQVEPSKVIAKMHYEHPIFTHEAVAAAARLREGGGSRLAFAGAHLGWGFHEDGARSGVMAARKFGVEW